MKQPQICERKRNGKTTFYCELNGKQCGLGTDREQAAILFADLLGKHHARQELTAPAQPTQEERPALTVRAVLFDFLKWVKDHRSEATYLFYLQPIAGSAKESKGFVSFDAYLTRKGKADLLVADFGPKVVEGWITDHFESKSDTYRH
ncbi:MAG: hypothetical protein IAF94_19145, partial [Pirellulaceae bacterium]|nr:hypothetical protein [Pirellulaceae bacterium]